MKFRLFTRKNLLALIFCVMVIDLVILTGNSAPIGIYQGF